MEDQKFAQIFFVPKPIRMGKPSTVNMGELHEVDPWNISEPYKTMRTA